MVGCLFDEDVGSFLDFLLDLEVEDIYTVGEVIYVNLLYLVVLLG